MAEAAVVVEADGPAVLVGHGFAGAGDGFVADDFDVGGGGADEFVEEGPDDGRHAGGEDDDRDGVREALGGVRGGC